MTDCADCGPAHRRSFTGGAEEYPVDLQLVAEALGEVAGQDEVRLEAEVMHPPKDLETRRLALVKGDQRQLELEAMDAAALVLQDSWQSPKSLLTAQQNSPFRPTTPLQTTDAGPKRPTPTRNSPTQTQKIATTRSIFTIVLVILRLARAVVSQGIAVCWLLRRDVISAKC